MFHGVSSELILLEKSAKKDLKAFCSVIFYRCSSVIRASYLCTKAKKLGIKLFFDIDDLIFDIDIINKSGLPYEEKQQYLALADGYREVMQLCDGLITSTEKIAEYLRSSFFDKPVCVRRNSASLEMETLSICAGDKELAKSSDTIYLAYFSGSWTHDKDFALIAKALVNIFKKYSNVKLRIYGCLHIPKLLDNYQNRIEMYDFTSEWQTLPEKIAQAHIHLAPLEDTIFNVCKSENKWTEAALAGRPIVASYNSELERVIKNGETGFLCKTEPEWEEVLSKLIENAELRKEIGNNAQQEVLNTHLTRNSGGKAVKFILK